MKRLQMKCTQRNQIIGNWKIKQNKKCHCVSESENVPEQDLMVWILRSKTRTLAKWVMSPANLKMFIFVELEKMETKLCEDFIRQVSHTVFDLIVERWLVKVWKLRLNTRRALICEEWFIYHFCYLGYSVFLFLFLTSYLGIRIELKFINKICNLKS